MRDAVLCESLAKGHEKRVWTVTHPNQSLMAGTDPDLAAVIVMAVLQAYDAERDR